MRRGGLALALALACAACGPIKVLPPAQEVAPRKQPTGPPLPPAPGVTVLAHIPVPLDEPLVGPPAPDAPAGDGGAREIAANATSSARPDAPAVPEAEQLVALAPPEAPEPGAGPLARGAYVYALHCATCHGAAGAGDGPSADALLYPPADLTRIAERRGGVFVADEIAAHVDGRVPHPSHGTPEAPIWGPGLAASEQASPELASLLVYLEALQRPAPDAGPES